MQGHTFAVSIARNPTVLPTTACMFVYVCVFACGGYICVCKCALLLYCHCIAMYGICSNLETANHVSCGHHRHLMVDKLLTHDYHVIIN